MRKLMIAASLVAASQANIARAQAAPDQAKILVDGYGEVRTMPDIATISYGVRGEGATSDAAVRAMTVIAARIEVSLRRIDPMAAPTTDGVRVSPVKGSGCKDRDYDSDDEQMSTGTCAIVGYVARLSVDLRTTAVKDAGTMVRVGWPRRCVQCAAQPVGTQRSALRQAPGDRGGAGGCASQGGCRRSQ